MCCKKLVAFFACHNLCHQSWWAWRYLSTQALWFLLRFDRSRIQPLTGKKKKAILLTCSARQRNYLLFLETKVSSLSLFASCIPTRAHTETHGWFGTAVLPATSSLSFPPLSPWRQASRAGWFQTVVNQHRLKREGEEEGVSLCLNMTKRTLWALCYLSPHTEVIKVSGHSREQADVQKEVFW